MPKRNFEFVTDSYKKIMYESRVFSIFLGNVMIYLSLTYLLFKIFIQIYILLHYTYEIKYFII